MESPPVVESTNFSGQIIVIVILVIIAIILFVYLLIISVNIPPVTIVPFANGSTVRIRSLANNLYLKPVSCSEITGCSDPLFADGCPASDSIVIAAVGQPGDPQINWQLCEYSSTTSSDNSGQSTNQLGEAKYLVYLGNSQGTQAMASLQGFLKLVTLAGNCTDISSGYLNCATQQIGNYLTFILNERTQSGLSSNTTSGSYQMYDSCDLNNPYLCTGQGNTDLTKPGCVPFVVKQSVGGEAINCSVPVTTPICILNYLFEIDVVS